MTTELLFELVNESDLEAVLGDDIQYHRSEFGLHYLTYPHATSEELMRKATLLSLDARVRFAEPNFDGEAQGLAVRGLVATAQQSSAGDCGPDRVAMSVKSEESGVAIQFSRPRGTLILFESANTVAGPWSLLTNFVDQASGSVRIAKPNGSNLFIRAVGW